MSRKMSPQEQQRAKEWTNKWPRKPVIYNAQYDRPRDVRTFIFDKSYILEDIVRKHNLVGRNDDETAYKILIFVMINLKYTGDKETKGQVEFWQNPEDTATLMKGDCEDGAILIKSLSLIAGIPDYKVRIAAGMVKGGGHAYVLYLRDDDTQCVLDWCIADNVTTKVNTPIGCKRFPELKVDDEVLGFNQESGKIEPTKIVRIGNRKSDHIYRILYEMPSGRQRKIFCTGEHPWMVKGVWLRTDEIQKGDEIYWVNPRSLVNMFQRKEQYKRTSIRQTENNIFTRPDVRRKLSKNNCMKRSEIVKKSFSKRTQSSYRSLPEQKFMNFCKKQNLPIRFVGDGSFWVKNRNPDFKVEGEKKIIEVTNYGYLNRNEEWALKKIKHFEENGFKAMVVFYNHHSKKMFADPKEVSKFVLNGIKVVDVEKIGKSRTVWNIHCEPHNNYFVNGLLSHNCYWPNKKQINERPKFADEANYYDIWFSFNRNFTFAEQKRKYGPKK